MTLHFTPLCFFHQINRLLLLRHPLLPLSIATAKLPLPPFPQTYYSCTRRRMNSEIDHGVPSPLTTAAFCTTNKDLSTKKCVPCNAKDLQPMTQDEARTLLPQVADWNLVNEDGVLKLRRSWKVKTFTKGLEFFRIVADLAEAEGHHPDLHLVGWNNVTIEIWTHSVGGLTQNDFILAAKVNELNLHGLLRRKASN